MMEARIFRKVILIPFLVSAAFSQNANAARQCTRAHKPQAVARLGSAIFVRQSARPAPPGENQLLYSSDPARGSWIMKTFDLELTREAGPDTVDVHVDRQADPSDIALSGNSGSGRAAYVREKYNVKGIGKTSLSLRPGDDAWGTGQLEVLDGIWETAFANVADIDLETKSAPIVGMIQKKATVPARWRAKWRDAEMLGPLETVAVVRSDEGALDRPSHLFAMPEAQRARDLGLVAERFGMQDAEKYIERIEHGAWSAGNISLEGHLLDVETASTVVGRHPQFSLTGKYLSNSFGFEGHGQMKLLESMAEDPGINRAGTSLSEISNRFYAARERHLKKRILDLFGFREGVREKAVAAFSDRLRWLTHDFEGLAGKMYPDFSSSALFIPNAPSKHVFDFSALFRTYPLLRSKISNRPERLNAALKILASPPKNFKEVGNELLVGERQHEIKKHLTVRNESEYQRVLERARAFIDKFDQFMTDAEAAGMVDPDFSRLKSYRVNADRNYLVQAYGADHITQLWAYKKENRLSPEWVQRQIDNIVRASSRKVEDGATHVEVDHQIFQQGMIYRRIRTDGTHRLMFELDAAGNKSDRWEIAVDGKNYPLRPAAKNPAVLFSEKISNEELGTSPQQEIQLTRNGKPYQLSEFSKQRPLGVMPFSPRSSLRAKIGSRLNDVSKKELERAAFLDGKTLNTILKFLEANGLTRGVHLEFKQEGSKAYVLLDPATAFPDKDQSPALTFIHEAGWASERFLNNNSGTYLIGQHMGTSKFATYAKLEEGLTKPQIIELLGLQGYGKFESKELYVIEVSLTPAVQQAAKPKVALSYRILNEKTNQWADAPNFLDGVEPGYTSAGLPEVVFQTFTVEARDLEDLKGKGITIRRVP